MFNILTTNLTQNTANSNSLGMAGILISILFVCLLFLWCYLQNKSDLRKKEIVKKLIEQDPTIEVEYRYFYDLRDTNELYTSKILTLSLIVIITYFLIFDLGGSIIASILKNNYISANNLPSDVFTSGSANYSLDIYNEFVNANELKMEVIIYVILFIAVAGVGLPFLIQDIKKFNKKYLLWGLLGFGLIIGCNVLANLLLQNLGFSGDSSNESSINDLLKSSPSGIPLMCLVTIILAPIIEELVFRKSIFNLFRNKTRLGLVVSSLVFGGVHILTGSIETLVKLTQNTGTIYDLAYELIFIIPYTLMGLAIGLTYVKCNRNIWGSICAHMFNNAFSMIVTIIAIKFNML